MAKPEPRPIVISAFDQAVRALEFYLSQADSDEAEGLVGTLPALKELRAKFERVTEPDGR